MTRILLPTDFSLNAWHAITYALSFFEYAPCTFYVLHAHQVSPSGFISTYNRERETRLHTITRTEEEEKLDKLIQHLKRINKAGEHLFEGVLLTDSLVNAIGKYSLKKKVAYIVMGTQGASGLKEVFLGSNTVSVIKNITFCPLLAVPSAYEFTRPRQFLLASEYRIAVSTEMLTPLCSLARLWDARIDVVHISEEKELDEEQSENQMSIHKVMGDLTHSFETIDFSPSIAGKIQALAKERQFQMIVMMHSKHNFMARLTREPVIKKVAFKTEVPFMILPQEHANQ